MMVIGNCLAFIIIVMGTLLAAKNISKKAKIQFAEDILYSHNRYRSIHNVSQLFLNDEMTTVANNFIWEWTYDPMQIPTIYGSNMYTVIYTDDTVLNPYKIFDNWYYYSTIYNYLQEPLSPKPTDPFTQIVWMSTTEIGVGISMKKGVLKVLVLYYPAGNIPGQYISNVQIPRSMNLTLTGREKRKFIMDIVDSHNYYRQLHYSSNLVDDDEMCVMADIHLNEWITNQPITLSNNYGVNCYQMPFNGMSELDPKTIVLSWYKNHIYYEYKNKNNESSSSLKQTNPFTQVVWRSTERIGVGILIINNTVNVIVIYFPAGNQPGQYTSNVKLPKMELTDTEKQTFFQNIVDAHNYYRKLHYSSIVKLDNNLCLMADIHLHELITKQPITLSKNYGMNVYKKSLNGIYDFNHKTIVLSWYKKQIFYNFNYNDSYMEPSLFEKTNPFTQVVWKSTTNIGVGILIVNGTVNVMVIYSPAGNQPGQYTSNVSGPPNVDPNDRQFFHKLMTSDEDFD